jgi:hypothetical protein
MGAAGEQEEKQPWCIRWRTGKKPAKNAHLGREAMSHEAGFETTERASLAQLS